MNSFTGPVILLDVLCINAVLRLGVKARDHGVTLHSHVKRLVVWVSAVPEAMQVVWNSERPTVLPRVGEVLVIRRVSYVYPTKRKEYPEETKGAAIKAYYSG